MLFDADKLDVMGAFGSGADDRLRSAGRDADLCRPSRSFLERNETEADEAHSAYHEYLFKLRRVRERLYTEPARRIGERRHQVLCAFFDQLAAEAEGRG